MKSKVKQIGEVSLLFGTGLASHCLGNTLESSAVIASTLGLSTHVAQGIFTLGSHILSHGVYESLIKVKETFIGDVNYDLETAILNAYKGSLSQIEKDLIEEYEVKEKTGDKLIRYIFKKNNKDHEDLVDLKQGFFTPLMEALTNNEVITKMLEENSQLNPDDFLKKIIKNATPDYDKKDSKSISEFVDIVCEKFKKYFRHYFLQELKREDKAKTVYFTHLLEGLILNTKAVRNDFPIIRDFAAQANLKLPEILEQIKEVSKNVKNVQLALESYQNDISSKIESIQENTRKLIAPILNKQVRSQYQNSYNIFDFRYGYLDFIGRNEEISRLLNFIQTKDRKRNFLWWLVTGPGGMGKSRLAQKLCLMLDDYYSGFFDFRSDISLNPKWEVWNPEMPTLIVIDYALSKIDKVIGLIAILEQRFNNEDKYSNPIRLLLLDRVETKEWKEKIITYPSINDCMFKEKGKEDITSLDLQPIAEEYVLKIFKQVLKKENKHEWKAYENSKESTLQMIRKLDEKYRPLFIFLSAMALANGDHPRDWNCNRLLEYTLANFKKVWWKNVADKNLQEIIKQILTVNTFCGQLKAKEIDILLKKFNANISYKYFRDIYLNISECKVEKNIEMWEGLQPAILGEYFILETFENLLRDEPKNGEELVFKLIRTSIDLNYESTCDKSYMAWIDFYYLKKKGNFKIDFLESLYEQIIISKNDNAKKKFSKIYIKVGEELMDDFISLKQLKIFDRVLLLNPKEDRAWQYKGEILEGYEKYNEALDAFEKSIFINPKNRESLKEMIYILELLGKFSEALRVYDELISHFPEDGYVLDNKGEFLIKLGEYDKALIEIERSLEILPEHIRAWVNKGNALMCLKRYEEALDAYSKPFEVDRTCQIHPYSDRYISLKIGEVFNIIAKHSDALRVFKKLLNESLREYKFWKSRITKGNASLIKESLVKESGAELGFILRSIGDSLFHLNHFEEALQHYKKSLKYDPHKDSVNYNMACIYSLMNNKNSTLKNLERAINLNVDNKEKAKKDEKFKNFFDLADFMKMTS